jgi:hypothetical protein
MDMDGTEGGVAFLFMSICVLQLPVVLRKLQRDPKFLAEEKEP